MNEPQRAPEFGQDIDSTCNRSRQRSVRDALLISAWVGTYSAVLFAFRVTKAVEGLLPSKRSVLRSNPSGRSKIR
jgi:hypothetical protein